MQKIKRCPLLSPEWNVSTPLPSSGIFPEGLKILRGGKQLYGNCFPDIKRTAARVNSVIVMTFRKPAQDPGKLNPRMEAEMWA